MQRNFVAQFHPVMLVIGLGLVLKESWSTFFVSLALASNLKSLALQQVLVIVSSESLNAFFRTELLFVHTSQLQRLLLDSLVLVVTDSILPYMLQSTQNKITHAFDKSSDVTLTADIWTDRRMTPRDLTQLNQIVKLFEPFDKMMSDI